MDGLAQATSGTKSPSEETSAQTGLLKQPRNTEGFEPKKPIRKESTNYGALAATSAEDGDKSEKELRIKSQVSFNDQNLPAIANHALTKDASPSGELENASSA